MLLLSHVFKCIIVFVAAVFAFDLYDLDKSGNIDLDEAQTLIKDVYGAKFEQNVHARKTFNKLGALDSKQIDLDSFKEFSRKHQALLYPAFEMQTLFQRRVVGNVFWEIYSKQRVSMFKDRYIPIEEILAQFESRYNVGEKYKLGRLQSAEDVLDQQYTGDKGDFQELTPTQRLQDEASRRGMSVGQLQQEMNAHKKHVIRNQRTGKDIIPVSRSSKNNMNATNSTTSGVLEAKARDRRKLSTRTSSLGGGGSSTVHPTEAMGRKQSVSGAGGRLKKTSTTNDLLGSTSAAAAAAAKRRLSSSPSMTADGFEAAAESKPRGGGRRASTAAAPSLKGVARTVMVGASGSKKAGRRGSVA
jgi:hypothetical protein